MAPTIQLTERFHHLFKSTYKEHNIPKTADELNSEAEQMVLLFHEKIFLEDLLWLDPHFGADCDGAITLEWWRDDRKLTIYACHDEISFIKTWGTPPCKTEDGTLSHPLHVLPVWRWLTGCCSKKDTLREGKDKGAARLKVKQDRTEKRE